MSKYWLKRSSRHLQLAAASGLLTLLFYRLTPPPDVRHRLSMATAYVALLLLGWTLALGPWNVIRSRPNPISFDLRRDAGIWTGILALFHTAVGLTVHLRGRMWMYFFKKLHPLVLQRTQFGLANYIGLIAALLFAGLLLLSNDLSLRSFGLQRWKALQRTTYFAFALTVLHGWAYQAVEKRKVTWIAVFWSMAAVATILQLTGLRRRKTIAAQGRRSLEDSEDS
jgi:methionine sulfoxide reductase heme-binding subunit